MSFSYDPEALSTELNAIRLVIGDTEEAVALLADEEIAFIQSEKSSFNSRVAECCLIICAKLAKESKITMGNTVEDVEPVIKRYKEMAQRYGRYASGLYPWSAAVDEDDKDEYSYVDNEDLVEPAFKKGMHDNT